MSSERRQSPRIIVNPPIRARVMGLNTDVSIAEVSFGGFRVESPIAFERNAAYELLVMSPVGDEVMRVEATVVHCRVHSTDRVTLFDTGFAFTDGSQSWLGIEALIGSVLSVLDTPGPGRSPVDVHSLHAVG
jgi:hypothetical protein